MQINSLDDLLLHELKDLYSAETQILQTLPTLIKVVTSPTTRSIFQKHLADTKRQVERLNTISQELEKSLEGEKCVGMEGLLKEGSKISKIKGEQIIIDKLFAAGSMKVEDYEICAYESAIKHAKKLGETKTVQHLTKSLSEEKTMKKEFSKLV